MRGRGGEGRGREEERVDGRGIITYQSHIEILEFIWEVCKFSWGTVAVDETGPESW